MVKEVVVVTGGTAGIGAECVARFSNDGYHVVFCGRNEEAGAKVAIENNAQFIKADITKAEEIEALFDQVKKEHGRLDVIVNNAAVILAGGKTCDLSLEDLHKMIDVNIVGAWHVLKYGVKVMEEFGNGGRVVNVGSQAGLSGTGAVGGLAHYGASKHALHGLTQIMALEYAPQKIRINAIAPTAVETALVKAYIKSMEDAGKKEEALQALSKSNPMVGPGDKICQPEDITGVIAFLCGRESKFINGVVLPIDGGYHCM